VTSARAAGIRTVAAFEAAKGLLVVLVGFGLLALVHRDVQAVAAAIVRHLHLNPARHYPRIFLTAAERLGDTRLPLLAAGAFAYAMLRFVEAYGLWYERHWAEWLAIGSGGLYLPVELYELMLHRTPMHAVLLLVNAGIVCGVLYVRLTEPGAGRDERKP
jgi:uncharacterized membrane protein (DUF2068 family)